jgi:hypothetical protein
MVKISYKSLIFSELNKQVVSLVSSCIWNKNKKLFAQLPLNKVENWKLSQSLVLGIRN